MFGQIHFSRVLYTDHPKAGARYRQIVVIEAEKFQVLIGEGEVVQPDPNFSATNPDAEIHLHSELKSALEDANSEFDASVEAGWVPYL